MFLFDNGLGGCISFNESIIKLLGMNILCGFQKDFPNYVDWILRLIMKNKAAAIIANIFIAFMITSCSNGGLSRDEASNPIKKALSEKNPLDLILLGGFNGTW